MIINFDDTIAAISSPPGEGGIAVIRLSGTQAFTIAEKIFRGKTTISEAKSHTIHHGKIVNPETDEFLDEVLLSIFKNPHSYTAEDVIEISSHGGALLTAQILKLCLDSGARLAQPGEFTQRAFLNGRLDLAQAEAVADMISARTEISLKSASEHLQGKLSDTVKVLTGKLRNLLALLEAYTDFPEEDLSDEDTQILKSDLADIKSKYIVLIDSYEHGKILKKGLKVPIVGKPNVGKSSLFNRLLDENRTIVTEIPGTTRDTVSEFINIEGLPVELIDTAGIRESGDTVEIEGIKRARGEIEKADLILALVDMTDSEIIADITSLREALGDSNYLIVANKVDRLEQNKLEARQISLAEFNLLPISASSGRGLDKLKSLIAQAGSSLTRYTSKGSLMLTNVRHRDALRHSLEFIENVIDGINTGHSYEFLAFDLKNAISSIEEIIGVTTADDILEIIFSKFCIGK